MVSRTLGRALRAARNAVPVVLLRQLSRPPILIGGCARSGNTLLLSILSSQPEIFAFPTETGLFCPPRTGLARAAFTRHLVWQNVPRSARRWAEKSPRNVLYVREIIEHFDGRVRLLHVVRDGRDVVTSRHPRDPSRYWVAPERWIEAVRAGLAWEGHPLVLTVRYEDLVRDTAGQLARLGAFLEEDFGGPGGEWHERAAVRSSPAWFHEVRATHAGSIGRWRDARHRAAVHALLAHREAVELLARLGYGPERGA